MSSDSVEKNWYRVLFNDKGVPVSVIQCEAPPEGSSVEYVYAESSTAAATIAVRAYFRRAASSHRARMKQEGRCRCGRGRTEQFLLCEVCRQRRRHEKAKKAGHVDIESPKTSGDERWGERQRDRRSEIRLEVLLEVRRAFTKASNNGQFAAWLAQEVKLALTKDSAVTMSPEQMDAEICSIADSIRESQLNQRRVAR